MADRPDHRGSFPPNRLVWQSQCTRVEGIYPSKLSGALASRSLLEKSNTSRIEPQTDAKPPARADVGAFDNGESPETRISES